MPGFEDFIMWWEAVLDIVDDSPAIKAVLAL